MDQSRLEALKNLVAKAKEWGADHVDVLISEAQSTEYAHRAGKAEKIESNKGVSATIRAFIGKKKAVVTTTDTRPESLEKAIKRAIEIANVVPEDQYAGPASADMLAKEIADLETADSYTPSKDELIALAAQGEEEAMKQEGVTNSAGASASTSRSRTTLVTSHGFAGTVERTNTSFSIVPLAEADGEKVRDYDYSSGIFFNDLEDPRTIGRKAAAKTVAKLDSDKPKSGEYPVVFDPDVSTRLIGAFYQAVSGDLIAQGKSFLIDDMGKSVFPENVTIIDDPTIIRGFGSTPFDREGMKLEKVVLVEKGVLRKWIMDLANARKMGLKAGDDTAEIRGTTGSTNLYLDKGTKTVDELIADIKEGFYVTGLLSTSQSLLDGNYSSGAEGFWIKDGKITRQAISEATIAGNLRDMFAGMEPADDLKFKGRVSAPTVRIRKMAVGGS